MALMTHEDRGLGNSERDLRKICKGAAFGSGIASSWCRCSKGRSSGDSLGEKER